MTEQDAPLPEPTDPQESEGPKNDPAPETTPETDPEAEVKS